MFLAVTPSREFWKTDEELLFIGPWCVPYGSALDPSLRHRFLPDPFRELPRYAEANARCAEVSAHFLKEISDYLGPLHGVRRDERYWRLLLDPWLTFHVEQMYDHFTLVEDAFRLDPALKTILLDPAGFETPRDTADFVHLKVTDRFHLQLFSQILATRLPDAPTRALPPSDEPAPRAGFKAAVKRSAARALGALSGRGLGEALLTELELTRPELKRLVLSSGLKALPYLGELPAEARPAPVFDARRSGLAGLRARDEFERVFVSALPSQLPTVFLEGYAAAREATLRFLPRAPKVFFSSIGWHYLDASKFAAAECAARGTRLWGIQHGGSYGMAEFSPTERVERAVVDRYYTWGWSRTENDPKLRDLPAPQMSRAVPAEPGQDLLFVSTIFDFHNIRLARDTNGAAAFDSLERKVRFLKALPEPARGRVRMRIYRRDFGWRQAERLAGLVPGLAFDDPAAPLARRLREARVVVLDYPSTPMLEALAAGVPCVLTWAPDTWTFRPSAKPFFDALTRAGIFYDSPEEAAAQAARAYADPRGWLDEPARRAAREAFTRTFALSSPDWLDAWRDEVLRGLRDDERPKGEDQ